MTQKVNYIAEDGSLPKSEIKLGSELISEILFVIVLYNTRLEDSLTYHTLQNSLQALSPDIQADLMICDNSLLSQVDINTIDVHSNFKFYYLHDSTNPGISLSYNRAVELASVKQKSWIMVFDQDTGLPSDAIEKYVCSLIEKPGFPIYAPKVFFNNLLLSPCRYYIYRGSPYENIKTGIQALKGKNVINSGLLIAIDAYAKVGGYDESVWLYFSDFIFFNRLKAFYDKFIVLDLCIQHDLSSSNYENVSFAIDRFTYYCQGAKAASNSSDSFFAYIGHGMTVALRSFLMCKRFKNIAFLKVFYNNYILSANEDCITS